MEEKVTKNQNGCTEKNVFKLVSSLGQIPRKRQKVGTLSIIEGKLKLLMGLFMR